MCLNGRRIILFAGSKLTLEGFYNDDKSNDGGAWAFYRRAKCGEAI